MTKTKTKEWIIATALGQNDDVSDAMDDAFELAIQNGYTEAEAAEITHEIWENK